MCLVESMPSNATMARIHASERSPTMVSGDSHAWISEISRAMSGQRQAQSIPIMVGSTRVLLQTRVLHTATTLEEIGLTTTLSSGQAIDTRVSTTRALSTMRMET